MDVVRFVCRCVPRVSGIQVYFGEKYFYYIIGASCATLLLGGCRGQSPVFYDIIFNVPNVMDDFAGLHHHGRVAAGGWFTGMTGPRSEKRDLAGVPS